MKKSIIFSKLNNLKKLKFLKIRKLTVLHILEEYLNLFQINYQKFN